MGSEHDIILHFIIVPNFICVTATAIMYHHENNVTSTILMMHLLLLINMKDI